MHREVEAHLMLSRMEPKRYVESKQARLTRRRLNAFRISFRDMMTEAIELPTMPNTARVVCKNRNGCMTNGNGCSAALLRAMLSCHNVQQMSACFLLDLSRITGHACHEERRS